MRGAAFIACSSLLTATALAHGGESHDISTTTICEAVCVGDPIDCTIDVAHIDGFGDTSEIVEVYLVVDPFGSAVRVPQTGSLAIVGASGNTNASVGGGLPARIGPPGSTLSGLPGDPSTGVVQFGDIGYLVQPGDPDPLLVRSFVIWRDLCDAPGTVGCTSFPHVNPFAANVTLSIGVNGPVCPFSTGNPASVIDYVNPPSGGVVYEWSIDNGTIESGQGTEAILFGVLDETAILDVTIGVGVNSGGPCIPVLVVVQDKDDPIIKCPPIEFSVLGAPLIPGVTAGQVASDDCTCDENLVLVSQVPAEGTPANAGVTPVLVTVSDQSGNSDSGWVDFVIIAPDVDRDMNVDVDDLNLLIQAWGPCPIESDCPADANGDGQVGVLDLVAIILNWS